MQAVRSALCVGGGLGREVCSSLLARPTLASRGRFATTAASSGMASVFHGVPIETHNPSGKHRVVVTKRLPGSDWLSVLTGADCRVDICTSPQPILDVPTLRTLIGEQCHGVIGQLTEDWGTELYGALGRAGGTAYSNFAVGFNNVDVAAATAAGVSVGVTPGVLTETTAELAVALTFAAARRTYEAEEFMRAGKFVGFLPDLFVGKRLHGATLGIIGTGRIGAAYARMMVEGHKMNMVYFSFRENKELEEFFGSYSAFLKSRGEEGVTIKRLETVEDVLRSADVVSLHTALSEQTRHLINSERLAVMRPDAILVNSARGPIINEAALVRHLAENPHFTAALDVFEDEPAMAPGLADAKNAVLLPHIGSATLWTRAGMAKLAACNVAGRLSGYPVWNSENVLPFVDGAVNDLPRACPKLLNATELGIPSA